MLARVCHEDLGFLRPKDESGVFLYNWELATICQIELLRRPAPRLLWRSRHADSGAVSVLTQRALLCPLPFLRDPLGDLGDEHSVIKVLGLRNPFVYRKPIYFS